MSMRIITDSILREVEISITQRCTLACSDCGFLVPVQPAPAQGEPVAEHSAALEHLRRLGIRIRSLAVLGGEPTVDGSLLERAVRAFRAVGVADRIEVVSNGLTPQGVTAGTLAAIDHFTVSDYGFDDILLDRWRQWLARLAPHVELSIRRNAEGWDPWSEERRVSPARARAMYDTCWYRKHCITLERGRLFACSRIAKLARDDEGLPLDAATTTAELEAYLHGPNALPSCATCTPMMGLPMVPAGVQPDDRVHRLQRRAIAWFDAAIARSEEK